jgi:hypothetical protein
MKRILYIGLAIILAVMVALLVVVWWISESEELLYAGDLKGGSHVKVTYTRRGSLVIEIKGEGTWILSKPDCYVPEREIERVDQDGTSFKITFKDGSTLEFERPTFEWKDADGVILRSGQR